MDKNITSIPDDLLILDDNDYYKITKAAFIEWLCTPKSNKSITTITELADAFGITRDTLHRWKRDDEVKEKVFKRKKQLAGIDDLPNIIDSLAYRAMATNPELDWKAANRAAKIFLEWVGSMEEDKDKGVLADLVKFTEAIKDE